MKDIIKLTACSTPKVRHAGDPMYEKCTIYLLTRNIVYFKKHDTEGKSDIYLTTGETILVKESPVEISKTLY